MEAAGLAFQMVGPIPKCPVCPNREPPAFGHSLLQLRWLPSPPPPGGMCPNLGPGPATGEVIDTWPGVDSRVPKVSRLSCKPAFPMGLPHPCP